RDQRGVGIGAVEDYLHRSVLALVDVLGKARQDLNRQRHAAAVDKRGYLVAAVERRLDLEVAAGSKARNQFAAFLAVVKVDYRGGDVVNVERGGVAEHDHLH